MRSTARSASDDRQAARVLEGGFANLRFPPELEAKFRHHHLLASQRWVRLSILVALGTTLGFAMIDHWVIHSSNAVPDLVRFGLQVPAILLCLLATIKPLYMRVYLPAIQVAAPLFGMGSVMMAVYAEPQYAPLVGARLLLVAFFLYFMLGMRFAPALRSNLIVLGALIVAGLSGAIAPQVAIYLAFAVLCANVIGGAGAYALEHANRTAFLERQLLGEMAALDGLTRLLNRQTFESRVSDVWREATARHLPISVLMIDVDDFKRYNDHYGHLAGDECLQRIAQAVRTGVAGNPADLLARYGGEELIAVLINRTAADAEAAAQRIVADVAALAIPHAGSSTGGAVSISVGVATHHPAAAASYQAVARTADNALYAAKHQGRNRCVCVKMHVPSTAPSPAEVHRGSHQHEIVPQVRQSP
ncbi:MAG TPA: diguanylate cyclase [Steroidobacteraceae bacterium]|jgi:diguanylate cyclase (GGDEF)-like protein|nr:diguanylate cyclase [Steroidobacteraceae bacterium]